MFKKNYLLTIALLLLSSCKNSSDDFTEIKLPGNTLQIELGSDLSKTVFVDLSSEVLSTVTNKNWDLAFNKNGQILINTSLKASILNTNKTHFDSVTTSDAASYDGDYVYETTDGDFSKMAIGDWKTGNTSKELIYILNLGTNSDGSPIGHKKFQIKASNFSTSYTIEYADIDGGNSVTKTVMLSTKHNFTYYSLQNNATVVIEPETGKWDIALTSITIPTGPPFARVYRSTVAAQLNTVEGLTVYTHNPASKLKSSDDPEAEINKLDIKSSAYDKIAISGLDTLLQNQKADAIGRSWLQILKPHRNGVYKIYSFKTFVIKDNENRYFKLRFTAYRNPNTGKNGFPTFEYKEIK